MAEVLPVSALHYDLAAAGALGDVVAPPYDVIDPALRAELVGRSPFNVVEIDLPEAADGADPYAHAAETLEAWTLQGIVAADREPTVWALTQDYVGPDGVARQRRGLLARVRVTDYGAGEIRPHERTQPGPKEDRLNLTRATRHNLSPIFSLHSGDSWSAVAASTQAEPWGEATDDDGTVNRVWRIADPAVHAAVTEALAGAELLIADGHHRYETARVYADEIGGDGPHRYTLMALTSLEDPGLTVFATHRLLKGLAADSAKQERLAAVLRERFDLEEVPLDALDPAGEEGVGVFGYVDSHFRRGFRLRLKIRRRPGGRPPGSLRRLPLARRGDPGEGRPRGGARDDARGRRGQARHRLRQGRGGGDRSARRRPRRRVPAAAHPDRGRARRGGGRRDDAPEVDLLLSQAPNRPSLQPAELSVTRIYTKKGDDGTTSLWYGGRVEKPSLRTEAYGTLDEAASALGVARALCEPGSELAADILRLQDDLFIAGAELATAPEAAERLQDGVSRITEEIVADLEAAIDRYMERVELPPKFVIPGGNHLSAQLDVARATIRRAERRTVEVDRADGLASKAILSFLNRASDLAYAMARFADVDDPELFAGRERGAQ